MLLTEYAWNTISIGSRNEPITTSTGAANSNHSMTPGSLDSFSLLPKKPIDNIRQIRRGKSTALQNAIVLRVL
jgi:hypothetical protein